MKLDIKTNKLFLSYPFRTYLRKRAYRTFERSQDKITMITITMADINGPRGGEDKQCKLRLSLDGLPSIMVVEQEDNLYKAFSKALSSADHALKKKVGRFNNHRQAVLLAG